MKLYKLKPILISVCCAVTFLWTEIQGAEEPTDRDVPVHNIPYGESCLTGTIMAFSGDSVPDGCGWLLCNGTQVSSLKYPELYAVIGEKYAPEDEKSFLIKRNSAALLEKTFYVPDLRGRVIVGVDGGIGRVAANNTLGASGGEERHKLTVDELAKHYHELPAPSGNLVNGITHFGMCHTGSSLITDTAGGDQPHNNMQPYLVLNYIINTGKTGSPQTNQNVNSEIIDQLQQQIRQIEIVKEAERMRVQEILAIREPSIDECINLYNTLVRFSYTYGELGEFFDRLKELYACRSYNKEGHGTATGKYIERLKIRINRIEVEWLSAYKSISSTNSINDGRSDRSQVLEVANIIRDDLCESMELYKVVHGIFHPRWDEFSKM